jgi:hypothetical protein
MGGKSHVTSNYDLKSNANQIYSTALHMTPKIHISDNIITLATETQHQHSNLLLFCMFMTYSTFYCHLDKLKDPKNTCMQDYMA